jgi:hypothetical protein
MDEGGNQGEPGIESNREGDVRVGLGCCLRVEESFWEGAGCFLVGAERFPEGAGSFFLVAECFSVIADRFFVLPEYYRSIAERFSSVAWKFFSISENYFAMADYFSSIGSYLFFPSEYFSGIAESFFVIAGEERLLEGVDQLIRLDSSVAEECYRGSFVLGRNVPEGIYRTAEFKNLESGLGCALPISQRFVAPKKAR